MDNRFEAFETRQLLKLIELQNRFRDADSKAELNCHAIRACQYLFYCPRPEGYSPESREQLDYYLMQKAAPDLDILHDYGYELYRLYEHALYSGIPVYPIGFSPGTWESGREETSHVPGLLVSDLSWLTKNYLEWDNQQQGWIPKKGCKPPSAKEVLAHIWSQVVPLSHFVVMSMLLGRCGTCSPGGLAFIRGESGAQNDDFPILPRHVLTYTFEVGTARG
ncbi:MAG TPA: hypothetical protein VEX13_13690 [Chloroflexia bacterium]|nr:hypothetical protein [Chloroflexia bacterium]